VNVDKTQLEPASSKPQPVKAVEKPARVDSESELTQDALDQDSVTISSSARAAASLQASPHRIEELRKQFKSGSYEVDANEVSRKILESVTSDSRHDS
jgi:flagellar biosynthesis anti-sigma factor FlgM